MSSNQQHEHGDHGNSNVNITVDDREYSIHRGNRPVAEIKQVASVPQTHVLEAIINGALSLLDDAAAVVLKGGERFISHLRDSASS